MISLPLLKQTIKSNIKFLLAFTVVLCIFLVVMCNVFTPQTLNGIESSAQDTIIGKMLGHDATLIGFMSNSFYALMAIIFPMAYSIMAASRMIAQKVDRGDMSCLLATPTTRNQITITSMVYLVLSLALMWIIASIVGLVAAEVFQPDALDVETFLWLNVGCFLYHFVIGGICFFFSCICNLSKNAIAWGTGISLFFFVDNLMLKLSEDLDFLKYITLNTLIDIEKVVANDNFYPSFIAMGMIGIVLYCCGIYMFRKRDLPL